MAKTKVKTGAKSKRKSRAIVSGKGPGKPKRVFTPEQMNKMGMLALDGCMTETIANLMEIPRETIDSRPDIQRFLTKKRCERKRKLLKQQNRSAEKGTPALLIWLGKNVLGQKDQMQTTIGLTDELSTLMEDIRSNGKGIPIKT